MIHEAGLNYEDNLGYF